jgi:DNA-directed RNA polymerases I, II, and III subunit RPABC3
MSRSQSAIFDEMFEVKEVDSSKFDKVSRIECTGEAYDMELSLDINSDIYPIKSGERITLALATTLSFDGAPDEGVYDANLLQKKTLMDQYEYVMYGRVFKFEEEQEPLKLIVYASFGGLLMRLKGAPLALQRLKMDQNIYLLTRKV